MRTVTESSLRRAVLRYYWRSARPFLAWGVILGAVFLLLFIVWPLAQFRDMRGSALLTGQGVVVSVVAGQVSRGNWDPSTVVGVRMAGQEISFSSRLPLRVGEAVRVDYRVGRSGKVYVEGAEPVRP